MPAMGFRRCTPFVLSFLLTATAVAQDTVRIAVIGASVSGGFEDGPMFGAEKAGDSVALHLLLRAVWRDREVRVSSPLQAWMVALFQDPEENGKRQLDAVLRREPDLVLALDFPFWFGYVFRHGRDRDSRLALQDKCFELLDRVQCPLIVGDYPDMTGAARRMISPGQIPDAETLAELNGRLREWASARKDTWVFPLSEFVAKLRGEGHAIEVEGGKVDLGPADLLQADRLHANRLGMAVLGLELQGFLRATFPEDSPLRPPEQTASDWVSAARANAELEAVAERGGK